MLKQRNRSRTAQPPATNAGRRFGGRKATVPGRIPGTQQLSDSNKGVVYDAKGNSTEVTKATGVNLIGNKLTFSISVGTTYLGGPIPLLPSTGSETLPTGVTYSGTFATYALFAAFTAKAQYRLTNLLVTTDFNSNFLKNITVTEYDSFGNAKTKNETWDSLGKNFAAQDQSGRTYEDLGFMTGDIFNYYAFAMQIPGAGTYTMSFSFVIDGVGGASKEFVPAW